MTDTHPIDYQALVRCLAPLALSPAELHGSLCGYLCGGGVPEPARWLAQLCIDDDGLDSDAVGILERLRCASTDLLDDPDLRFAPLLPDPDTAMAVRVEALAAWCASFLGGLGLSGGSERSGRSAEAADAIGDLQRIARFGYEAGDQEEDEGAFAEILEYVRMAVILLRQEAAPAPAPTGATRH